MAFVTSTKNWSYPVDIFIFTQIFKASFLFRLRIFEKEHLVADSGNIFDLTLKGGRLGVFVFSQKAVIWSNLVYRCNEAVPKMIYDRLPPHYQSEVDIDTSRTSIMIKENIIGSHN